MSQESPAQPPELKPKSTFASLGPRVITGLIMAAVVLAAIFLAPLWALASLIALLAGVGMWEYSRLVLPGPWGLEQVLGILLAACIPLAAFQAGPGGAIAGVGAALVLVCLAAMLRPGELAGLEQRILQRVMGVLYAGGLFACLLLLAMQTNGRVLLFYAVASVALADVGAYFTGKALGRHSLAKSISPKKTIEGLWGGMAVAALAGLVIALLWLPQLTWWQGALISVILAGVSVVGDLFESLIKRVAGAKDSAGLFPGHGGLLDRVDAHLTAGPVLLLIWLLFFSAKAL